MNTHTTHNYAVIMAGGSGTRLWPVSRQELPKQMQKFIGDSTLINETVERLLGFISPENIYIATTSNYADKIKSLLPEIPSHNIIIEPMARGTTAGLTLATRTIYGRDPEASIFYLASDHAVTDIEQFQDAIRDAFGFVAEHPNMILLVGIKPTRPDTGLGYIKKSQQFKGDPAIYNVEKFVEKPSLAVAKKYLESGDYYWNAAYYCFKAETLLNAYQDADPTLVPAVEHYLETNNPDDYAKVPVQVHEIEIIDATKFPLVLLPAEFGWSDIGNWRTLHEVLADLTGDSLVTNAKQHIDLGSTDCFIYSVEDRLVATVGLQDIVIVDTPDVLMVMNKKQPQEIKNLLQMVHDKGMENYL
jgi:mannose-1-phosphate guanylyltransferase